MVSGQQVSSAARVCAPRVIGVRPPGRVSVRVPAALVASGIWCYACPLCVLPGGRRGGGQLRVDGPQHAARGARGCPSAPPPPPIAFGAG